MTQLYYIYDKVVAANKNDIYRIWIVYLVLLTYKHIKITTTKKSDLIILTI